MSSPDRTPAPSPGLFHRFSVLAAAEASVMSRTLELFAKRGLVPERFAARRAGETMVIDVEVAGLEQDTAEHITRCLAGMVTVERVLMDGALGAADSREQVRA
ncbi:MAG: hypothetical protein JNL66_04960 [Alphaproteobacteria bacterium]|nr:hypothetical protein [Alphaproteobacteria bacterium]